MLGDSAFRQSGRGRGTIHTISSTPEEKHPCAPQSASMMSQGRVPLANRSDMQGQNRPWQFPSAPSRAADSRAGHAIGKDNVYLASRNQFAGTSVGARPNWLFDASYLPLY